MRIIYRTSNGSFFFFHSIRPNEIISLCALKWERTVLITSRITICSYRMKLKWSTFILKMFSSGKSVSFHFLYFVVVDLQKAFRCIWCLCLYLIHIEKKGVQNGMWKISSNLNKEYEIPNFGRSTRTVAMCSRAWDLMWIWCSKLSL